MAIKDIVKALKEQKYDTFRTETKSVLMEKAVAAIEQRKTVVGKNYLGK